MSTLSKLAGSIGAAKAGCAARSSGGGSGASGNVAQPANATSRQQVRNLATAPTGTGKARRRLASFRVHHDPAQRSDNPLLDPLVVAGDDLLREVVAVLVG